jgi:uncharacterized protein (DUF1778 family)
MSTPTQYKKTKQRKTELLQIRVTPEQKLLIKTSGEAFAKQVRALIDSKFTH